MNPDSQIKHESESHLLVVDDEKEILFFWELLLKDMGYQVTAMQGGIAAYEWLSTHADEIDAVITDMSMPKMTGLELAAKIKELAPSLPIALCRLTSDYPKEHLQ